MLMVNSYATYKILMKFLRECHHLIKCTIDTNKVLCENTDVKSDIELQLKTSKIKIKHITFYIYLQTYEDEINEIIHPLLKLPFDKFPVYKKGMIFDNFIKKFIDFSTIDIKSYNTRKFETRSYDFTSQETCQSITDNPYNTNPEFPSFKQSIFHAGNKYQIDRYGIMMINSLFSFDSIPNSAKVQYDQHAIINTINYAFTYLKKGIIVGIKDNKIVIFLPMSKHDYRNDYFEELYFDNDDKERLLRLKQRPNDQKLLHQTESTVKHYFNKFKISKRDATYDRRNWYLNGCLIRYDTYEGDKLVLLYLDFLTELCKSRTIEDCVFLINTRDFPILRKDRKHPNTQVIDRQIPHEYLQDFCPILSSGVSINHDDVPFVTPDDWLRLGEKFYPDSCKNGNVSVGRKVPWSEKSDKVLFRGTASGCGITTETNMRLKLVRLAKKHPDIFDAGLSNFNYRMKKNLNEPIRVLDSNKYERGTFIDNDTKPTFKYILNIDGHVSAFRLGYELQIGSVILLVESDNRIWISDLIEPYVHYVPINPDLSNILEIIQWCKDNDSKCMEIANNAEKLFHDKLQRDGVFDHMQQTLNKFQLINNTIIDTRYPIAKKIGIIICYRDDAAHTRYSEMIQYRYYVGKMLEKMNIDFRIIVAEQSVGSNFNIGKLKNIGYKYLIEKEPDIDYFIFTDVDMIPNYDLLSYFIKIPDGISMLAYRGTRYNKRYDGKDIFVGGCIGMSGRIFEQINGYSNNYDGGWGGEDDSLALRLLNEKIKFYIPRIGEVIDIEEATSGKLKNIKEKVEQIKAESNYNMLRYEMLTRVDDYALDGLGNCIYDILDESFTENYYHILVDVQHEKQRESFPDQFDYSGYTDEKYKKMNIDRKKNTPKFIKY